MSNHVLPGSGKAQGELEAARFWGITPPMALHGGSASRLPRRNGNFPSLCNISLLLSSKLRKKNTTSGSNILFSY